MAGNSQNAPGPRSSKSPTYQPPPPPGLTPVLERNIESLTKRRSEEVAASGWETRVADAITSFTGSMPFVYFHLALFGFWIVANLSWVPGVPPWDPSFVVLAMIASVEAIFLSTFILISQNRMAVVADKRADLDLQISLLVEHELTKMAVAISGIGHRLGIQAPEELEEVKRDVAPTVVLDQIEAANVQESERSQKVHSTSARDA